MKESSARAQVLAFVKEYPGVHAREVERQLGLSSRLAGYHLDALERSGDVSRLAEKGYVRFLPQATRPRLTSQEMAFICLMRRAVALRTVVLLLARSRLTPGQLARTLGLAKASATYNLGLLTRAGIVTMEPKGRERWYELADPAWVRGALAGFTPLPEDLDPFSRLWDDLFG
jgi:predicted transcriptional regulator